jgi:hypothetical protein
LSIFHAIQIAVFSLTCHLYFILTAGPSSLSSNFSDTSAKPTTAANIFASSDPFKTFTSPAATAVSSTASIPAASSAVNSSSHPHHPNGGGGGGGRLLEVGEVVGGLATLTGSTYAEGVRCLSAAEVAVITLQHVHQPQPPEFVVQVCDLFVSHRHARALRCLSSFRL